MDNPRQDGGEDQVRQVAIVLVGAEDAFIDLFQHFPPRRYPLIFARDGTEALEYCEAQRPPLLILPLGAVPDESQLLQLLRRLRALGTQVIGLTRGESLSDVIANLLAYRHEASDIAGLLKSTAVVLGERRAAPRVNMEIELSLGSLGKVMATVISGRSLFVPHALPVNSGQMIQVSIETSHSRLQCWASVVRVNKGDTNQSEVILGISEKERDVRAYLDGLVRGMLLLEHAESASGDPQTVLPPSLSDQLIDRLTQQIAQLRGRLDAQVALTESLTARLDAIADAEAKSVKWRDVRPVLAEKWSAQRELIKKLTAKVDAVVAGQRAGQPGLHEQRQVIDELAARIEVLQLRGEHLAEADKLQKLLDDHSVQLASLSLRLDEVYDQLGGGENDRVAPQSQHEGMGARRLPVDPLTYAYEDEIPTTQRSASYASQLFELDKLSGRAELPGRAELSGRAELDGAKPRVSSESDDGDITEVTEPSLSNLGPQLVFPDDRLPEEGNRHAHPTLEHLSHEPGATEELHLQELKARIPTLLDGMKRQTQGEGVKGASVSATPLSPLSTPEVPSLAADKSPPDWAPGPDASFSGLTSSSSRRFSRRVPWWLYVAILAASAAIGGIVLWGYRLGGKPTSEHAGLPENGEVKSKVTEESPVLTDARAARDAASVRSDRSVRGHSMMGRSVIGGDGDAAEPRDRGRSDQDRFDGNGPDATADAGVDADVAASSIERPRVADLNPLSGKPNKVRSFRSSAPPSLSARNSLSARKLRQQAIWVALKLMRRHEYPRARARLTWALQQRDDSQVRVLLARTHRLAGEPWPAIHHMKKAVALDTEAARPRRQTALGELYLRVGQQKLACEQFAAALAARPDYEPAQRQQVDHCR